MGSNRSILWDHFLDVVCVLVLEAGLAGLIELLPRLLPSLYSFLQILHRILIWSAIATVGQFAVCSFVILLGRNLQQVRRTFQKTGEGDQ